MDEGFLLFLFLSFFHLFFFSGLLNFPDVHVIRGRETRELVLTLGDSRVSLVCETTIALVKWNLMPSLCL